MANPIPLIYKPFAYNGERNTIQPTRQTNQEAQDAVIDEGFPKITMIPEESGGLAPNGQDFNGIFYLVTADIVHRQKGEQMQYDADHATNIGGYSKGAILQSTSLNKSYISQVDNNLTDPDSTSSSGWAIYAGSGAVKNANASTYGLVKIADTLASYATDTALTANQGRILDTGKLSKADLVDSLTSTATWTAPTANQVRILDEKKLSKFDLVDNLTSTATWTALTANQGRVLDNTKLSKSDLVDNLTSNATWTAPTANQARILNESIGSLQNQINNLVEFRSGANGYIRIGSFFEQWGVVNYDDNPGEIQVTVTFPRAFPNACTNIVATRIVSKHSTDGDAGINIVSMSKTQAIVSLQKFNSTTTGEMRGFYWTAKGN